MILIHEPNVLIQIDYYEEIPKENCLMHHQKNKKTHFILIVQAIFQLWDIQVLHFLSDKWLEITNDEPKLSKRGTPLTLCDRKIDNQHWA